MMTKMARIRLTSRVAQLLALGGPKNLAQVCSKRSATTDSLSGWDDRLVFTHATTILPNSNESAERQPATERRPIDQRIHMLRLRNNFARPGPGLRLAKNRNDLVAEFYDLSNSVIEGRVSVNSLINSKTFTELDEQLTYHIDIMSNNQIVNILASLIKMGVNASTGMVKLLEHEVKFRINSISLSQVMKLVKFYSAIDTSYEQEQLSDILNNRIRSSLNNPKTTVKELVDAYQHLISHSSHTSMFSLTEERLLNLLTEQAEEDDDMVSRYIPKFVPYDYVSLCNIFIQLAAAKRRPTPLLKAASTLLAKVPLPKDEELGPDVSLLIATLNSLVSLNYIGRSVVSKLIADLTDIIDLGQMDVLTKCNLLRSIASLKWRSEPLLKLFYDHVRYHQQDVDHRLILTLIHITAKLNYKPDLDMADFYNKCIRKSEDSIDHMSRKWLDHVWSLTILGIAHDLHLKSILNDKFMKAIENPGLVHRIQHSDGMKILNLSAIATLENKLDSSTISQIDELASIPILRGSDMQKFAARVRQALNGLVESEEHLLHDIKTPFGFIIDSVVGLNENSDLVPLDKEATLRELTTIPKKASDKHEVGTSIKKIAIVQVLFHEVIMNYPMEPVGHKRIVSRILDDLGYRTIFLPEGMLNREKTSADLAKQIRVLIDPATKSTA